MRLDPVAGRLIHKAQTSFIHGTNIMNGVLALYEILHETKRKKQVGIILKLDFKKAYDKVHWGFLLRCLKARGFNDTWCSWISQILNNDTVAVKLNSVLGSYFQSYKGVRLNPIVHMQICYAFDSLHVRCKMHKAFSLPHLQPNAKCITGPTRFSCSFPFTCLSLSSIQAQETAAANAPMPWCRWSGGPARRTSMVR
jgi:hypothetical protein